MTQLLFRELPLRLPPARAQRGTRRRDWDRLIGDLTGCRHHVQPPLLCCCMWTPLPVTSGSNACPSSQPPLMRPPLRALHPARVCCGKIYCMLCQAVVRPSGCHSASFPRLLTRVSTGQPGCLLRMSRVAPRANRPKFVTTVTLYSSGAAPGQMEPTRERKCTTNQASRHYVQGTRWRRAPHRTAPRHSRRSRRGRPHLKARRIVLARVCCDGRPGGCCTGGGRNAVSTWAPRGRRRGCRRGCRPPRLRRPQILRGLGGGLMGGSMAAGPGVKDRGSLSAAQIKGESGRRAGCIGVEPSTLPCRLRRARRRAPLCTRKTLICMDLGGMGTAKAGEGRQSWAGMVVHRYPGGGPNAQTQSFGVGPRRGDRTGMDRVLQQVEALGTKTKQYQWRRKEAPRR
jgi:hypothetical protein